jgi:hypothetical protein
MNRTDTPDRHGERLIETADSVEFVVGCSWYQGRYNVMWRMKISKPALFL